VLFAGGGVTSGAVYGASDAATMFWALGLDPSTEFYDTLRRPLPIAAGKPVTQIFT
jgi:hypothetical protein